MDIQDLRPARTGAKGGFGRLYDTGGEDYLTRYDALSYKWGDPTPTGIILLSNKLLPIAASLTSALQYQRYVDTRLTLWVDAVCIDQSNVSEREAQVKLMRHIFSQADTVRIWINEPDIDENGKAVILLEDFCNLPDDMVEDLPDPSFWEPIMPIFTNPYWNRVWIQQEVINARQTSLHCFNIVVPGSSLYRFLGASEKWLDIVLHPDFALVELWYPYMIGLWQTASSFACHHSLYEGKYRWQRLQQILETSAPLEMTDSRDRLYALMHLAHDYQEGDIRVDYTKTTLEIMVDAASHHISTNWNLEFLRYNCRNGATRSHFAQEAEPFIPTWLPGIWMGVHEDVGKPLFLGAKHDIMQIRCSSRALCVRTKRLRLKAFQVDVVRRLLSPHFGRSRVTSITIRDFWDSLLGLYLRVFGGLNFVNLSHEAYQVLTEYPALIDAPDCHVLILDLCALLRLNQHRRAIVDVIGLRFRNFKDLLDDDEFVGLMSLYDAIHRRLVVMTTQRRLGLMPDCDVEEGDEIWIVLGSSIPVVLRPQSNGNHWHICTIYVPKLFDDPAIQNLSDDVRFGDKVGEWTVTDITIER